jgi:hypothetical protein
MNCNMCGKAAKELSKRWYQYDNGEQFVAYVCKACVQLHFKLSMKVGA